MKKNNIPLLDKNAFDKNYLKEPVVQAARHSEEAIFFEINHKCNWKDHVDIHRLDFYLVFLVMGGEGIHTFGLQDHYIRKNMLCFVGPHMVSSWKAEVEEQFGYFCTFSEEFFNLGKENKNFLSQLPFFQIDGDAVLALTDDQMSYFVNLLSSMEKEFKADKHYLQEVLRNQLEILLYKSQEIYYSQHAQPKASNHAGIRLLKAFTKSYQQDFDNLKKGNDIRLKSIAAYAEELGVSQNHLNDTIKAITGISAGQTIRQQLIKHATICLQHTSNNISQIAYRLGYDDPSYFSRFYKSQTGKSPTEVRAKANL